MYKRTKEVQKEYDKYLKTLPKGYNCFTDSTKSSLIIEQWKNWAVRVNEYPYKVKEHVLFYPIRPCKKLSMLLGAEMDSMYPLLERLLKYYSYAIINSNDKKSVNNHLHFHLIKE